MSDRVIFGLIGAVIVALIVLLYESDKEQQAAIRDACSGYLRDSRSHSDSLHARMACDQLWASKRTEDAANAAAMAAGAAAGAAAGNAGRSYR